MSLIKKITKNVQDSSFLKRSKAVKSNIDFSLPSSHTSLSSFANNDETDNVDFGSVSNPVDDDWIIDEKTGKKYRKLPQASSAAIKASKSNNGGFSSIDQLRKYVGEVEDFDLDNLDGMANEFLAHLRVPPDKSEQKRLAEERKKQSSAQNSVYDDDASRLADKFDKDLDKPFDFGS